MDALKAIFSRRSIRKYTSEPIDRGSIETLLRAAMVSPSAFDERPWHFVVVDDSNLLKKLGTELEHCEMLNEATLAILVCGDERLEKMKGFWIQDCSACTENILLASHAMGIGAVWIAIYPVEDRTKIIRANLNLPPEVIPFALVSMGYPAEQLGGEERYDKSRVHRNTWSRNR